MNFAPDIQHDDIETNDQIDIIKYKYALENSHIGVWEWDMLTNKVYHSNESKIIFGYENSEMNLSDTNWTERIHPDDLESLQTVVNEHIQNVTTEYISEHRILCNDGSYKWVLDRGKVVDYDANNNPIRFIGTTIDITKRKEDEESLTQSVGIITNQNKKLTNFAHIVTHNLKEHAGNFESLLSFYKDSSLQQDKDDIIDHLITVSDSLTNTISNLRDIVSKQLNTKIEIKPLIFNDFVNRVKDLLEVEIIRTNAIINNNVSNNLTLYSNEAYLESIVLNLASNALKYSHPERSPIINIDSIIKDDTTIITLADNGIGIDLDKHGNNIFGLYKTFHDNENSEGIGLHITKNQIEALGGHIDVQSTVNKGTTFIITIKSKKNLSTIC